jgi:hypothetical protein
MLQISHREALQVMACCHEGLFAETLVRVPWNIRLGLWTLDSGGEGGVMGDVIIHLAYVQVLLCKMLSRRHVKLSKELVHNALLRCLMLPHTPRALA